MTASKLHDSVAVLLARSLEAWRISGDVRRDDDGGLHITAAGKHLRIARAPADLPFRWMVSEGERTRGATSVSGVLRAIRTILDPGYRPVRLRIAPLPPPAAPS